LLPQASGAPPSKESTSVAPASTPAVAPPSTSERLPSTCVTSETDPASTRAAASEPDGVGDERQPTRSARTINLGAPPANLGAPGNFGDTVGDCSAAGAHLKPTLVGEPGLPRARRRSRTAS